MSRRSSNSAQMLLTRARQSEARMLEQLETLVKIESPSDDKAAVDRAVAQVADWANALGGRVRLHRYTDSGDSLEARFGPLHGRAGPVLLLGHLDTVWDHGTLKRIPWRVTRDRISGPGVLDMKAGVVMMLTAISLLAETGGVEHPIVILLHGDEEVGSHASRKLTETIARQSNAVYVLEPAQGKAGAYKTARKGVGQYRLEVQGVAAHSGVDFSSGHSAVLELARQVEEISKITDLARGITVNAGVIGGGTRSNVIAAEAWAEIDARIARRPDGVRVERALRRLRPRDKACKLLLTGEWNRPPMERSAGTVALFRRAQHLAAEMGFALEEASTGGGSDGNFTAALGIPTLDGMGAVGSGAHALSEHCLRQQLAPRTALLAAMVQ
ncbi:MAG TPA: M20 family metallopeptidase [Acidobacteriaceae bacterium]